MSTGTTIIDFRSAVTINSYARLFGNGINDRSIPSRDEFRALHDMSVLQVDCGKRRPFGRT